MFASWGTIAHRHRLPVLIVVLLGVIAGGAWGLGLFDRMSQGGYEVPDSEAVRAGELAERVLGEQGGDLVVVYRVPGGASIDDPGVAAAAGESLRTLPQGAVTGVTSYWRTPVPQLANPDRTSALATITLAGADIDAKTASYERIADELEVPGVRVDVAGQIPVQASVQERAVNDLAKAEAVSLPVVLVLLVLIFGGLVAAALPVLVGGMAVFGSLGLLHLVSLFADVNVFAINVASLLGLGLAIDYGLFIVGRFREELAAGNDTGVAVRRSVASAGRTVAFSATLLVIALAGLTLFPQAFLKSLAYGGVSAVALAALLSLTALPAILGMLGRRVDALPVRWRGEKVAPAHAEGRGWRGLATGVMRRPLTTAVPIVAVLLLLGAPFLGVRFGAPDERMLPASDPARQAVEVLETEFPAMASDSIRIVIGGSGDTPPSGPAVRHFLAEADDVPGIEGVRPAGSGGSTLVVNAVLSGPTYGERSGEAVREIRELAPPEGTHVLVGGPTALNLDSLRATAETLPWVAALLVGATLVLMFLAFGSFLLPVKAVVLSALSLSATFGLLTWIFVDGHGAELLNVTPAPLEVGIVVLMASVAFGLSTDYEVFLLSRMVEARAGGASTEEAVRTGIARTGRVITAAALLLIVVTGAFTLSGIILMRFIGVGMILALALDATVIRMVLVPAVMKLLGRAAWWAPGPLRRLQRRAGPQEGDGEAGARGGDAQHASGAAR